MSKIKKFGIIALSVVTVIGLSGVAPAKAMTNAEIQTAIQTLLAQIQTLQAQLAAQGGSTGSGVAVSCDFTRNLYPEMSGSDVKCLQEYLNAAGYTVADSGAGSAGNETEYFGSLTKAAVTEWQDANGIQYGNWAGYFGPSSQAKYDELAAAAPAPGEGEEPGVVVPDEGVSVSTEVMDDITVPQNATLVELADFTFIAGEDVELDNLDFERESAGSRSDWDKLYIYDGGSRLTSGRTINSNHELSFSNLGVEIAEGETKTLTLKGTVSSTNAGNVHYFEFVSAEMEDEDIEVSGLPLVTREVTLSAATAGSISVEGNIPSDTTAKLGDTSVQLFSADFTASSEDMDLGRILLTQYGSIDVEEFENYYVKVDGSKEDATIDVDGDEITIEFDTSYYIEKGDNVEVALYADMSADAYIKGGAGDIQIFVDEDNDVYAEGRDYGYGANVSAGTTPASFGNPGDDFDVILEASDLTFTFEGPSLGDIGLNDEGVVLYETKVNAQADYEIKEVTFKLDISSSVHLQDLKLVNKDTNHVYAGPDEIASSTGATYHSFDDIFTIEQGVSTLQLLADVGTDTVNSSDVTVTMIIDSGTATYDLDAENLDTSEAVTVSSDVIPADELAGKKQTFTQPNLTIAKSPTPTAQTYVVGRTDTILGAYVLEPSAVSDIDVRQLRFRLSVSSSTAASLVGSLTLYKDSVSSDNVLDSESVDTGSVTDIVSFDTSSNLNLSASGQTTVYLVGNVKSDFDSGYLTGANTDTATTSLTSVTAKDDENNDPLFNSASTLVEVDGATFTIAGSGSFDTIAFSGSNPSRNSVITPADDILFQSYRLRPQNEDIQMRDFVLDIVSSTEASYFYNIFVKVDGVEQNSKVITGTTRTFEDYNFDLTKDEDTTIEVMADLVSSGFGTSLTSGAELQLYFATSTGSYDIVGVDSGSSVAFTTSSIDTAAEGLRTYQVAKAYPTFDVEAIAGEDLTDTPQDLFKVKVSANDNDIEMRELTFDVTVTEASTTIGGDLTVDNLDLYRDGTDIDATIASSTIGAGQVSAASSTTAVITNTADYTIESGTSATFTLRGTVSNVALAADENNTVRISLNKDDESGSYSSNATEASVSGLTVWGDTYMYFNGYYLQHPSDEELLSN